MKKFNTRGLCSPKKHYMVNVEQKATEVIRLIDEEEYFTINRPRQYGKSNMLNKLKEMLQNRYYVLLLNFEYSGGAFSSESAFFQYFIQGIGDQMKAVGCPETLVKSWLDLSSFAENWEFMPFYCIAEKISELCDKSDRAIVLMIDEADKATNNEIFLHFLGMLRGKYLARQAGTENTFQSVILVGVTDIKNLKAKIRPEDAHGENSPWNIAADFKVDMSFNCMEIAEMLQEYELDHATGMNVTEMASSIREYTSGYPFLVSRICQCIDEDVTGTPEYETASLAWTKQGFLRAVRWILNEDNALFSSIVKQLIEHSDLNSMIREMLFQGISVAYNAQNPIFQQGIMYGILQRKDDSIVIANRIFATVLFNYYLSLEKMPGKLDDSACDLKNQFVTRAGLDMDLVLQKFQEFFTETYQNSEEKFVEDNGRKIFLLYLRAIINGSGNYYVETRTISNRRTDVIVDYRAKQYIVEMKIWHGQEYNARGEKQLSDYLEEYHLTRGYMLSFNFNKNKVPGVHEIQLGEKTILEAVV